MQKQSIGFVPVDRFLLSYSACQLSHVLRQFLLGRHAEEIQICP